MRLQRSRASPGTGNLAYDEEMRNAAVVGFAVVLAFAIRVAPARTAVFGSATIDFQDNDSWFHMRSVHNLVAHFPTQSGFDPYALFPGGQPHQNEPWDLAMASLAWVLGAGRPGARLVDGVGAWLPAIMGAILPIPVFLLGRRLFGELAGQLSAVAVAVIPGTLLWETHLGVPDHHVAECLLALLALLFLCSAAESRGRARIRMTALAGLILGAYLCVRPAGIFVPATLALAALIAPELAPLMTGALGLTSAIFLASAEGAWTAFTWLSLGGSIAVCLCAWAADGLWRKRQSRRAFLLPAACLGVLVALGIVAILKPAAMFSLASNIRRYLPGGQDVTATNTRELYPLWKVEPRGIPGLFTMLGGVWILALPSLIGLIPAAWRARRPALTLFVVWAMVMTVAGTLQLRMLVYTGPAIALAAGAGSAWLIGQVRRFRPAFSVAFAAFFLATCLPAAIPQSRHNGGPDAGWLAALDWLGRNTPDPMGTPDVGTPDGWLRLWPKLRHGEEFAYPATAYGVLTWWDFGDWVNAIAHRLPTSNGTQAGADLVARFLTATGETTARGQLSRALAHYVVLNPEVVTETWPTIVAWARHDLSDYRKTVYARGEGRTAVPLVVYLPNYYRSMAVRMYAFDGRRVAPREVSVFTTRRVPLPGGREIDGLIAVRKFPSLQQAYEFMGGNTGENLILGSLDPTASCAELEDLPWVKRVFASDERPPSGDLRTTVVKVFEVTP